jgi:endoglucanase
MYRGKEMKIVIIFSMIILLIIFNQQGFCQKAHFNKGVNLTNWFQVSSAQQIQFSKYSRTDFEQIKSLGCDVVRLPINLHFMTNGKPDYTIDPLFYTFLDQVVGWCEELGIHLILDNHTFDVTTNTDPLVGAILEKVWSQMAVHYLNTSNKIYFEILNEPHGIADNTWNEIQQKVVTAIRKVDTKHTLVVGPASWNSYNNLNAMPVYSDTNLIYTFHFYDPFLFTHQGASWTDLTPVSGIPFPYSAERMPVCPTELKGTWVESNFNSYKTDGTIAKVKQLINIAVNFSKQRNVPVFCGEFGVYNLNSPPADRVFWYNIVRSYLEENNVAWTIWDYHGAFGLYEKNSNGFFEHDLNVPILEALGMKVPEQTPYIQTPDEVGFPLFTDFIGKNINEASYGSGTLNYYSTNYPNRGDYCISWKGAAQYEGIVFDFAPKRDLSYLKENGFALSLLIRGDDPNGQFDIRFIDSKTDDPDDHPWRMRSTLSKSNVQWDKQWHKLYLPLSGFKEHGSWDNEWFDPQGKFDWTSIDKLEICTEYNGMGNFSLWIDDLTITNLDTSKVNIVIGKNELQQPVQTDFATIHYSSTKQLITVRSKNDNLILFRLVDMTGRYWNSGSFRNVILVETGNLPAGIFLIYLESTNSGQMVRKLVLN